jgi:hypothetical protein
MKLGAFMVGAALTSLPAGAADRWELRGDDGAFTNNVLQPGVVQEAHDLGPKPGGAPDTDWYKVLAQQERSYEVRVFGGGVVWKYPACPACATFERVQPDGTVIAAGDSDQTGGPPGLSLRWIGGGSAVVFLRVNPYTDAPGQVDEKYDILLHDTTLYLPRFNNVGAQRTVVILQNTRDREVSGSLFFHDDAGAPLYTHAFVVASYGSLVLDASSLPALQGRSGSAVVAHTGGVGAFTGKGVALDPTTGFTFDTAITTAPR